jgi:hypothetical protein
MRTGNKNVWVAANFDFVPVVCEFLDASEQGQSQAS